MLVTIGSGIILNVFLAACRGWFFRTTFGNSYQRQWLLVISCISSGLLASFPLLASSLGLETLRYTSLLPDITRIGAGALLISIVLIPTIIYIILGNYPTRTSLSIAVQLLLVGSGVFLLVVGNPGTALFSRALVAIIEERTKTTTSLGFNDRFSFLSSDIIFFGLLSALGFAFIENFVYLRTLGTATVGSAFGLVIKRMLTSWVMHMSYTGLIAVGVTLRTGFPRKKIQGSGLTLAGIVLHTLFNATLSSANFGITLLLIVFGYLFMSRLIYKSERVYIGSN